MFRHSTRCNCSVVTSQLMRRQIFAVFAVRVEVHRVLCVKTTGFDVFKVCVIPERCSFMVLPKADANLLVCCRMLRF